MTVAFGFLFRRYVAKHDWHQLLAAHELCRGRIWPLFPACLAGPPWQVYRFG